MIVIVLNLGDIFYLFLDIISVGIYYREAVVFTISSTISVPRTSLKLVFLASLNLMGRRLLVLTTRCISERSISGLSFLKSFSSFFADLLLWGHLKSISRILKNDFSNTFASSLTAFSTTSSQESSSWPRASNWAQIKDFRPSRKYWIIIFLFRVAAG